jgi:hypothetical protein
VTRGRIEPDPVRNALASIRRSAAAGLATLALLLSGPGATLAACLTLDQVYEISGGSYPKELIWSGTPYSSTCACSGSTSGISGGAYACSIGETCRCGTFNGKPWMGKVIHRPDERVQDFGSTPKPFVRTDQFFLFFAEVKLVKNQIGCTSERGDGEAAYECPVAPNSVITLSGGGGRSLRSVTLYWKGELPEAVASRFADLYGGDEREALYKELGRTTPREGRRRHNAQLGTRRSIRHELLRVDVDAPAEHWVTIQ